MKIVSENQFSGKTYFIQLPQHTVLTMSTTNMLMLMNPSLAAVTNATPGMQGASVKWVVIKATTSRRGSCLPNGPISHWSDYWVMVALAVMIWRA